MLQMRSSAAQPQPEDFFFGAGLEEPLLPVELEELEEPELVVDPELEELEVPDDFLVAVFVVVVVFGAGVSSAVPVEGACASAVGRLGAVGSVAAVAAGSGVVAIGAATGAGGATGSSFSVRRKIRVAATTATTMPPPT
jgi:hypothetical protein